ncbi:MAG: hypothetical protein JJT89_02165 [Nitriliruptoraceae bacterium]|nr:hypothetical protein [Nitriliruptoraceae bacterium]
MDALNTLRAILVGCAFFAAMLLVFQGQWVPAAVLFVGIAAHAALFVHLRRQKRAQQDADPLHGLT